MFYSDQNIQDYLDGRMSAHQEAQFEEELGKNRQLRDNLDAYRMLYAELEDDSHIQLGPNFTASIMKKANLATFGSLHFSLWQIFIGLFVLIVAINISFIYVDTDKLINDVSAKPQPVPTMGVDNQVHPVFDLLNSFQINTPIPVLAGIILLILFLIDRRLMKYRKRIHYSGRFY